MSKHEKLFEIVAFAVAALALALFFAAMAALIVVEPETYPSRFTSGFVHKLVVEVP